MTRKPKTAIAFLCAIAILITAIVIVPAQSAASVTYRQQGTDVIVNITENDTSTEYLLGDLDNNGAVSLSDTRSALRGALNIDQLDYLQETLADVNQDGAVTLTDTRGILRAALNIEHLKAAAQTPSQSIAYTQSGKDVIVTITTNGMAAAYLLGDIDNDGKVTAADARTALRASAKLEQLEAWQEILADVNRDESITAADARKILRVSARLESFSLNPEPEPEPTTQPTTQATTQLPVTDKGTPPCDFKVGTTYESILKPYAESLGYSCSYTSYKTTPEITGHDMSFIKDGNMVYVTVGTPLELGPGEGFSYVVYVGTKQWVEKLIANPMVTQAKGLYFYVYSVNFIKSQLLEYS
jgi:hypothetical protein